MDALDEGRLGRAVGTRVDALDEGRRTDALDKGRFGGVKSEGYILQPVTRISWLPVTAWRSRSSSNNSARRDKDSRLGVALSALKS